MHKNPTHTYHEMSYLRSHISYEQIFVKMNWNWEDVYEWATVCLGTPLVEDMDMFQYGF